MPPPKKIVITGPESTGKTTLARQLALRFAAVGVREYSRWYLSGRSGYREEDLWHIARGQARWERAGRHIADRLYFCDTSLEVIEIWSRYKYGRLDPRLERLLRPHRADLYLLCYPDIDWEADPLRENPADREELFEWYERWMVKRKANYRIVRGLGEERLNRALRLISGE